MSVHVYGNRVHEVSHTQLPAKRKLFSRDTKLVLGRSLAFLPRFALAMMQQATAGELQPPSLAPHGAPELLQMGSLSLRFTTTSSQQPHALFHPLDDLPLSLTRKSHMALLNCTTRRL